MITQTRTLGPTEIRLLNRLAADGHVVFSTTQARAALDNGGQDINKLLSHLTRKRWLLRLEKGKHLILPLEAGMEGLYSAHEQGQHRFAQALSGPPTLAGDAGNPGTDQGCSRVP